MHTVLGDRSRFAAEIGGSGPLRRVDLWAAGKWLTCDDNMAYVPQFRHSVLGDAAWLRSGGGFPLPFAGVPAAATHRHLDRCAGDDGSEADHRLRDRYRSLHWGPTTDNLIAYLFRDEDRLVITLRFWREEHLSSHPDDIGAVFVAELLVDEFVGILEDIAAALGSAGSEHTDASPAPAGRRSARRSD